MSEHAIRAIQPGELRPLRGVLEESGRELVGRVRVGGMTYHVRAVRRGLREWALHLQPLTVAADQPTRGDD